MNISVRTGHTSLAILGLLLLQTGLHGPHAYAQPHPGDSVGAFVAAQSGGLDGPSGLIFGPDGHLYVSSFSFGANTDAVLRYDGTTGAFIDAFVQIQSGGLDGPTGLAFGPDGHLYVGSANTDAVLRYDGTTGAFIDAFVSAQSGGLDVPTGLAFGPNGHLYVSSARTDAVLRYDGTTGAFIDAFIPAQSGGLDEPRDLIFRPDGNLYVASEQTGSVLRFNSSTGAFIDAFVPAASGGLAWARGLAFGPDGHLYVSSFTGNVVFRYDGTTGAFIDAFIPAQSGGLSAPIGLTFGEDGFLYVSSFGTDEVLLYAGPVALASGTVTFQVDMSREMRLGNINFPAGEIVGVRGSHTPLGWERTTQMLDADGDSVFTVQLAFTLPERTDISYKFVQNIPGQDPGDGWEGDVGSGGTYGDRMFTFTGDEVLPVVYFNNVAGVATEAPETLPKQVSIMGAYPNPFYSTTRIVYELARRAWVEVKVYDVLGRRVAETVSSEQGAGRHEVVVEGGALPTGVYFFRIVAGMHEEGGQLLLLR